MTNSIRSDATLEAHCSRITEKNYTCHSIAFIEQDPGNIQVVHHLIVYF